MRNIRVCMRWLHQTPHGLIQLSWFKHIQTYSNLFFQHFQIQIQDAERVFHATRWQDIGYIWQVVMWLPHQNLSVWMFECSNLLTSPESHSSSPYTRFRVLSPYNRSPYGPSHISHILRDVAMRGSMIHLPREKASNYLDYPLPIRHSHIISESFSFVYGIRHANAASTHLNRELESLNL